MFFKILILLYLTLSCEPNKDDAAGIQKNSAQLPVESTESDPDDGETTAKAEDQTDELTEESASEDGDPPPETPSPSPIGTPTPTPLSEVPPDPPYEFLKLQTDLKNYINEINYVQEATQGYGVPSASELTAFAKVIDKFIDLDFADADLLVKALDYRVYQITDTGGANAEIYCLLPIASNDQGRGVFCVNPNSQKLHHISAPHPLHDSQTNEVSVEIFRASSLRYLAISTTHRCANSEASSCSGVSSACGASGPFRVSDMAHNENSFFHTFSSKVSDYNQKILTIQIHGCGSSSCPYGTANDVVARISSGSTLPLASHNIANRLTRKVGMLSSTLVTGSSARSCSKIGEVDYKLCATTNTQGRHVNGSSTDACTQSAAAQSNSRFLHIEANLDLRRDDGGSDSLGPQVLVDTINYVLPDDVSLTANGPYRPFPQHVELTSGIIKPSHRTQAQLDADVKSFYDYWKLNFLKGSTDTDGSTLYRVSFGVTNPAKTVSEGQGYGMMIVATMAGYDPDAQNIFDGLWRFSRKYPSSIDGSLMDFSVPAPGAAHDSAFDGDADISFAMLLANIQWGSSGPIDYLSEANSVISAIMDSTIGPASLHPLLGDWVDINGATYNQYTVRSSDIIPSHFRAYRAASKDNDWDGALAATSATVTHIQSTYSPVTGLLPDFLIPEVAGNTPLQPAAADFLEGPNDGSHYYNAARVPWRLALDFLFFGTETSKVQVEKMTNWIKTTTSSLPGDVKSGYTLSGTTIGNYFSTIFVAPFGVAAMVDSTHQNWLNGIYDLLYQAEEDYYEDSVNLLCLLAMTGNFWMP